MEKLCKCEDETTTAKEKSSNIAYAADLFSCLSADAQDKIIDLIKSLLSAK